MSGKNDASGLEAASWRAVVLVCKACGKRSSGPKKIKTKNAVAAARRIARSLEPRPRVLTTSCLGLCPKGALAVAMVGGAPGRARMARIESLKEMERLLPLLANPGTGD